jgi:hypothetical protein
MFRFTSLLVLAAVALGFATDANAGHKVKFKVRYENITTGPILKGSNGGEAPVAFAPGLFVVANAGVTSPIYKLGERENGKGLEPLAEDGNPAKLAESLKGMKGVTVGTFTTPLGADKAGPITPGKAFEFTFEATEGQRLFIANMWGQSNDLFYSTNELGIPLFIGNDKPREGDVTNYLFLFDAGTEVNEEPGFGPNQGPRQSGMNVGPDENGIVTPVLDKWTYPSVASTIRVTISVADGMMGSK